MIFTILREHVPSEATARTRLVAALKQHGGCEQKMDESQNALRVVREATQD